MRKGELLLALVCLVGLGCTAEPPSLRPCVLVVLADDVGYGDPGFRGSGIHTPAIDRLAREGVVIERFYAFPECSPSRIALFTARNPLRRGLAYSVIRPWSKEGIRAEEALLPRAFQEAGYRTALVGKWHAGHGDPSMLPAACGFDHFYGHLNGRIDSFTHHLTHGEDEVDLGLDWQRNGEPVIEEGYASFLLADEAIRLLDAATDEKPLFLVLSFNAAHPPLQAPQELLDRYAAVENPVRRAYAAMLDGLDRALGRVLDALDDKGRTAETLVFFLGDNGASTDHGGANGPLRGGKATTFEGGIRVPAIVRWPARLAPGSSGQVLSVLDVAPTLLAAVGIDPGTRNLDGQSYWRALLAGEIRPHQGLVVATQHRWMRQEALLDPRGKLVRETNVVDGTRRQALFDPMADPGETRDLSSERPDLVKELEERLDADLSLHPEDYVRPTWEAPAGWKPPGDWARATAIPGGR